MGAAIKIKDVEKLRHPVLGFSLFRAGQLVFYCGYTRMPWSVGRATSKEHKYRWRIGTMGGVWRPEKKSKASPIGPGLTKAIRGKRC